MFRSRLFLLAKSVVLVMASLVLNGCVVLEDNDSSGPSRGSLSDAMHASAGGGGSVSGSGSGSSDSGSSWALDFGALFAGSDDEGSGYGGGGGTGGGGGGGDSRMIDYYNKQYRWQVPVDVSYSVSLNGQIESMTRFDVTPISWEGDRGFFGFFLGGDVVRLAPGSLADQGAHHTWAFETGFSFRLYLAPAHSFISPYFAGNINADVLSWDYRHPVFSGSDVITDDSLGGVGGYAGFGIAIKRTSRLSLFGEVGFGGTVWDSQTREHFQNDVFGDYGYFNLKAGVTFKF